MEIKLRAYIWGTGLSAGIRFFRARRVGGVYIYIDKRRDDFFSPVISGSFGNLICTSVKGACAAYRAARSCAWFIGPEFRFFFFFSRDVIEFMFEL